MNQSQDQPKSRQWSKHAKSLGALTFCTWCLSKGQITNGFACFERCRETGYSLFLINVLFVCSQQGDVRQEQQTSKIICYINLRTGL